MKRMITAAAIGLGSMVTLWAPAAHAFPNQGPQELEPAPPAKPSISIADASITEGNAGTKLLHFSVTLSKPHNQTVKANVQTIGAVSNPATANVDYGTKFAVLEFAPGVTARSFSVAIKGDTQFEANEKFGASLSNVSNATMGKQNGMGTITNDDSPPLAPPPKPQPPKPQPEPQPEPGNDDEPAPQPKPNGGGSNGGGSGGGSSVGGSSVGGTQAGPATTASVDGATGEQALGLDGATDLAPEESGTDWTTWLVILTALMTGAVVLFLLLPPRRRQRA